MAQFGMATADQPKYGEKAFPMTFRSLPGEPRLMWAPEVHKRYSERCYIYLLTSPNSSGSSLVTGVKEVFKRIGVSGATYHIVYGHMDAMVRVWMTSQKRAAFVRTIQSPAVDLDLEAFYEFVSDEVEYSQLSRPDSSDLDDQEIQEDVRNVVEKCDRDGAIALSESDRVHRLLDRNLLFKYFAEPGIKAYLFILSEEDALKNGRETLRRAISGLDFSCYSLYIGTDGFCSAIVKVIHSGEYSELLPKIEEVQRRILQHNLTCWSLVPADYMKVKEGELITPPASDEEEIYRELTHSMNSRGDESRDKIRERLRDRQVLDNVQLALNSAKESFATLSSEQEARAYDRWVGILRAAILPDRKEFNRSLSFMISIESDIRDLIKEISARIDIDFDALKVPDRAGLDGSRVNLFNQKLHESRKLDSAIIEADFQILILLLNTLSPHLSDKKLLHLISDWEDFADEFATLRNLYAHGVLLHSIRGYSYDESFWRRLDLVRKAIMMQISLEETLNDIIEETRGGAY